MKIGLFTECYKPVINGVVHSIMNTKEGLEELGHEVYIFSPDYGRKNVREKNLIHCPSAPLPGKTGYHYIFKLPKKVTDIAEALDIVHTHHPFTMGRYASEIAKANSIPLLFTHHTQYDQYTRYVPIVRKRAKRFLYGFLKNFCNKCDLIIAPSSSIQRVIKSYGTQTPIQVVPNGIDITRFQEIKDLSTPRILSGLKPNYKIIIYTGRVAYEKNIDFIVKAFKIALTEYPEAYLLIVGPGPALGSLIKLSARIGLTGNIIFTGEVPYNQIRNYYHAADFFMTASKTEVHPLVILEALAAGLPVVAIDAIGTSDIITQNKTGYLTRENLDEFAKKIVYLLKNPVRLNIMSRNAIRKSNDYSIPTTAKKMVEAYKKAQTLLSKK